MPRVANQCCAACCALLLGWAGPLMAGDRGSTNGEVGAIAEANLRARDTPPQNFILPIPDAALNGSKHRLDCAVAAFRNSDDFDPRQGVRGRITADIQVCDPEVAPMLCTGVFRLYNRRFRTDAGGFALIGMDIPPERLGSLLDGQPASAYPNVIVTSRFTNRKMVGAYNLGCHIGPTPPLD